MRLFERAAWWSEEAPLRFTLHANGAADRPLTDQDVGDAVAAMMNAPRLDLLMTGGHATERGLELGFRKRAGWFGPKDGRMVVRCADGRTLPVEQRSPKAWMGVGNCLLGHVDGPDSLAAVAVEDFGARAVVGYVVVTWYGRGGWGTLERFTHDPGARTLNEAWSENCDAIVSELARRFPGAERFTCPAWDAGDLEGFERAVNAWAEAHGIAEADRRDLAGLVWDRDAVLYVGDPAWDLRVGAQGPGGL
jgi:zinc protease